MRAAWGMCQAAISFSEEPDSLRRMTPGELAQRMRVRRAGGHVSATEVSLRLSCGPDAISAARRGLDPLEPEVGTERLNDMRLLVSELVTNSVRHARSGEADELALEVSVTGELIHVRVIDSGPGFEASERGPDDDPGSGWGLFLVEQLSDRWGVDLNGTTQVWFELER
jgi:anti-sigma regulatory factor (Ser/Thr protein kinase)